MQPASQTSLGPIGRPIYRPAAPSSKLPAMTAEEYLYTPFLTLFLLQNPHQAYYPFQIRQSFARCPPPIPHPVLSLPPNLTVSSEPISLSSPTNSRPTSLTNVSPIPPSSPPLPYSATSSPQRRTLPRSRCCFYPMGLRCRIRGISSVGSKPHTPQPRVGIRHWHME